MNTSKMSVIRNALFASCVGVAFFSFAFREDTREAGGGRGQPPALRGGAQPQSQKRAQRVVPARQAKALEQAKDEGVIVVWGEQMQSPLSVRGRDLGARQAFSGGKGLQVRKGAPWKDNAIAVMDNLAAVFDIVDAEAEFELKRVDADKLGFNHVRLAQRHQGLRVVGTEMIVHFNAEGLAYEVNGEYAPEIDVDVWAAIAAAAAIARVREDLAVMGFAPVEIPDDPPLVIFALNGATPRLAYELAASHRGKGSAYWRYWIDAATGDVLLKYDDVKRIAPPSDADGEPAVISGSLLSGEGGTTVQIEGWLQDGAYYLYNTNTAWMIYNASSASLTRWPDARTYAFRMTSDWDASDPDPTEISAAHNIDLAQRYFREVHGRFGYNNVDNAVLRVNVHYTEYPYAPDPMANAFWDPSVQQLFIGDGDSHDAERSLAVLDIMAHEYTHAVTEFSANLIYMYESGALNESFSDIFGTCVEFYGQPDGRQWYPDPYLAPGTADWLIGEDTLEVGRDMRNPSNVDTVGIFGVQPSRYQGTFWWDNDGDNGGVHFNSGPHNFLFYLICEGGAGNNDGLEYDVTGIGIEKAEQIAYRVLTVYCTPNTGYAAVREAWYSATRDLYPECLASVRHAWDAIMNPQLPLLQVKTANPLPDGRVGNAYSVSFSAVSGSPIIGWSLIDGTLPADLTFTSAGKLSGFCVQPGQFALTITVEAHNGLVVTNTFDLLIRAPFEAPFSEGFDGVMEGPMTGWTQESVSGGQGWRVRTAGAYQNRPPMGVDGGKIAYLGSWDDSGNAIPNHVSRLVSPRIMFGSGARGAQLKFHLYMEKWTSQQDELRIYCKTNKFEEWGEPIATYTSMVYPWAQQVIDLPYAPQNQEFYIAFEGSALGGYGVCLDNIWVGDPIPTLAIITPTPLPVALVETNYTELVTLESEGGWSTDPGEYTYAIIGGALPSGFGLTPEGVVTGCSAVVQSGTFMVQVTDSEGRTATKEMTLLVELPRAPVFTEDFENVQLPGWTQKKEDDAVRYNNIGWKVIAGGGNDGKSPPFQAHSPIRHAFLYGVPSGSDIVRVKLISSVVDLSQVPSNTRLSFWHFMQERGNAQDQLRIYYRNTPSGTWNLITNYTENVAVWTHRTLPLPNLSSTYQIAFEGRVFGGYGVCVDTVSITDDAAAPIITTLPALPGGFVGFPYYTALSAIGGLPPYAWSLVSGALPAGLALNSDGEISGTPAAAASAAFSAEVMGSDGKASTNAFTLRVLPPGGIPFVEKFNAPTLPAGWSLERVYGYVDWVIASGTICPYVNAVPVAPPAGLTSNACLWTSNSGTTIARLISPPINLGSITSTNAVMTFQLCMAPYLSGRDQVTVRYRTNAVENWTTVAKLEFPLNKWTPQTLTLPNPSATYYIAFEGQAMGGAGICIADLTIFGNVEAESPFDAWRREYFTNPGELDDPAISGPDANPMGDGIPNIMKYAMGLDPNVFDNNAWIRGGLTNVVDHASVPIGNYLHLTYRRANDVQGVKFIVKSTPSLTPPELDWQTIDAGGLLAPWIPGGTDPHTGLDWSWTPNIHLIPSTNATQRFMRLSVELDP
ncbi:MAG: M4 family metallopeptidase [Kiritimatiellaeota bacterium]|nr:M4 family metallopeptidase [Kiritimatiellota bacterium]